MMYRKLNDYSLTVLLVVLLITSCAPRAGDNNDHAAESEDHGDLMLPPIGEPVELLSVSPHRAPESVREWIAKCQELSVRPVTDTFEYDGKTFIFVASGERPTGGYGVSIRDAIRRDESVIGVRVLFTRPDPDMMVTQVITYPFDVAAIPFTGISVQIEAEGNDRPVRR